MRLTDGRSKTGGGGDTPLYTHTQTWEHMGKRRENLSERKEFSQWSFGESFTFVECECVHTYKNNHV